MNDATTSIGPMERSDCWICDSQIGLVLPLVTYLSLLLLLLRSMLCVSCIKESLFMSQDIRSFSWSEVDRFASFTLEFLALVDTPKVP